MSPFIHALSRLLGWSYFVCWTVSFYPQFLSNRSRKSVTGLSIDYFTLNILGFTSYTVSALLFLFSPVIRDQYAKRHPHSPEPTVRGNDLAFAAHATILSILTYAQFCIPSYKRDPSQRLSRPTTVVIALCITTIATALLRIPLDSSWEWIDVVYTLQYVKLAISIVKYIPQVYLNYSRKATTGWSIYNILLDISGGALSIAQLVLDSSLQNDWSGLTGNPIKFFLGQVAILFDIVFIVQHYVLYRQPGLRSEEVEAGYGSIETMAKRRYVEESGEGSDDERRGLLRETVVV